MNKIKILLAEIAIRNLSQLFVLEESNLNSKEACQRYFKFNQENVLAQINSGNESFEDRK